MHKSLKIPRQSYNSFLRNMSDVKCRNPIEAMIKKKLEAAFNPSYMEVLNESFMHNVPKGSETHFKVIVISDKFDNQPLIKRHRMINDLLQTELQAGVHALSIVAKTPTQWEENKITQPSPACRGGFGK